MGQFQLYMIGTVSYVYSIILYIEQCYNLREIYSYSNVNTLSVATLLANS